VGDIPEIIRDGENGLLVEPGDPAAIADAILKLLGDPNLTARCGANALNYAREHFCFDRMMGEKLAVDLSLTKRKKRHGVPPPAAPPSAASPSPRNTELISSD
jgi:glycosyl transferase family 1